MKNYGTLERIVDKANRNDYVMFIGEMNARVGNTKVTNMVGANGEAALTFRNLASYT